MKMSIRHRFPRRSTLLRLDKASLRQQNLLAEKEKLLKEKEWLFRETHHRVRNSLQMITSFLNMHAPNLRDEAAIGILESIRSRVNSISLAHKKLYQETTNLTFIEMQDYMHELVGYLRDCISTRPSVTFQLDIQA